MYSTFLTASPESVLFSRSNLLKRKDLCFSCLRLGLIRQRRSLRSSHLFSSGLTRFRRVTTRVSQRLSVRNRATRDESRRVQSCLRVKHHVYSSKISASVVVTRKNRVNPLEK
jgi:hypothetical protein